MLHKLSTVGFEITNHCNLNCIHCYEGNLACDKHLAIATIKSIIEKVLPYNPKYFVLTGGEPFMHPEINKILIMLGEEFKSHLFYIASNGTLLTPDLVALIGKYNNILIQISLDGTKSTHDLQHGNSYDAVVHSIELMKNNGLMNKVVFQMTLSKVNYKDCEKVADFARDIGAQVKFQYVCMVGKAIENKELLDMTAIQRTIAYRTIKEYSEKHPEMGITAPKTFSSCSFEKLDTPISMNIDINGDILTCTCLDSSFVIGNIFTSSIEDIIQSPVIYQTHERVVKRKELLASSMCKGCIIYDRCRQGCIGRAIRLGNEYGLDGECDFRKNLMIFNRTMGIMKND